MSGILGRGFEIALEGSVILLILMLVRTALRRAPKKYICFLWMLGLIRLCCPYLPAGPISMDLSRPGAGQMQEHATETRQEDENPAQGEHVAQNSELPVDPGQFWLENGAFAGEGQTQEAGEGLSGGNKTDNNHLPDDMVYDPIGSGVTTDDKNSEGSAENSAWLLQNFLQVLSWSTVFGALWLGGAILALLLAILRYCRISIQLRKASPVGTYLGIPMKSYDLSGLPAAFGMLRPCIYVPEGFAAEDQERREYILMHEATHIERRDPLVKVVSVLIGCVYWWNPIVWISIRLLHKDMEMACDEGVLGKLEAQERESYARVLLFYATEHRGVILPVAFGESDAESRIKNILQYKKLPVAVTALLLAAVGGISIFLATRPGEREKDALSEQPENQQEILGEQPGDQDQQISHADEKQEPSPVEGEDAGESVRFTTYIEYESWRRGLGKINSREEALSLGNPSFSTLVPTGNGQEEACLLRLIAEKDEEAGLALQDPGEAAKYLLKLGEGTGRVIEKSIYDAYLEYTFGDGSQVYYFLTKQDGLWYPAFLMDSYWIRNPEREAIDREYMESCERENRILVEIRPDMLRKVTEKAEGTIDYEWLENQEKFFILDEAEEGDVTLYGLYGGNRMVLRVGDRVYPIGLWWATPQMQLPEIYCGDYDGDGVTEYALKTHMKTGTGVSGDELYVIETEGPKAGMYEFSEEKRMEYLGNIDYRYDEKFQHITVYPGDGSSVSLLVKKCLENMSEEGKQAQFQGLVFGDIERFLCIDGKWYYAATGGIMTSGGATPDYECSMEMLCPVLYNEEDGFSFGQMQFAPYYASHGQESWPEKVLREFQADLTHDGAKETIVLSITCEEGSTEGYEKLLNGGEVCYVRVYCPECGAYDPEKYGLTGGYHTDCAHFSWNFALAHAGNGMAFLVNREGKDYLCVASAGMWQGEYTACYNVYRIFDHYERVSVSGVNYVVDSASVQVSLNSQRPEEIDRQFPVEEMLSYTQKLNDWIKDGTLLVMTDVEDGARLGITGQEKYEAWEIWKVLERSILLEEEDMEDAMEIKLTGMENLEEVLRKLKERRLDWARNVQAQ